MQKYKIIIAYDGTDYFGWQRQPEGVPTVCGQIEKIFKVVFKKDVALSGASRTDCGVHAMGQAATFNIDFEITPEKLLYVLNSSLPGDIFIRKLEPVSQDFNIHRNVESKTYYYHFFLKRPLPFVQRYGWHCEFPINIEKLKQALSVFMGTHDFRSFCTGDEREDTVRTIDNIYVEYLHRFNAYRIVVQGPGFLRYMIRRIVGAAIEVAKEKSKDKEQNYLVRPEIDIEYLKKALEEKNPAQPYLPNAPSKGLLLYKIKYK